jgi:Na+/glutamate symporter
MHLLATPLFVSIYVCVCVCMYVCMYVIALALLKDYHEL